MTRRSLFKTAAAAFAGSLLAKLPLAGATLASLEDLPPIPGINPDSPALWVNTVWRYNPKTGNSSRESTIIAQLEKPIDSA